MATGQTLSTQRAAHAADAFGEEMADDARIWTVYAEEAAKCDRALIQSWNGSLDTLLIFSGLFSAVATAFIVESYRFLQPDFTELTFYALTSSAAGSAPFRPAPFSAPLAAVAVNCLWIISLIASLFTALVCILAKQWIDAFAVQPGGSLRDWAALRQFRADAIERWHVPEIIAWLPVLLHASLLIFLLGLVLFLKQLHSGVAILAASCFAAILLLYVASTFSPIFWYSSPFKSHLTPLILGTISFLREHSWLRAVSTPSPNVYTDGTWYTVSLGSALSWLALSTRADYVHQAVVCALGDLTMGRNVSLFSSPRLRADIVSFVRHSRLNRSDLDRLVPYFRAAANIVSARVRCCLANDAETPMNEEVSACLPLASWFSSFILENRRIGIPEHLWMDLGAIGTCFRYHYDARFFSFYEVLADYAKGSSISNSTALEILRTLSHTSGPWKEALSTVLEILPCLRAHFLADRMPIHHCIRQILPLDALREYDVRFTGGQDEITILCFMLTTTHPDLLVVVNSPGVGRSLIVAELMLFCDLPAVPIWDKGFLKRRITSYACLVDAFLNAGNVLAHPWTRQEVSRLLDMVDFTTAPPFAATQMIVNLLHPHMSWIVMETALHNRSQEASVFEIVARCFGTLYDTCNAYKQLDSQPLVPFLDLILFDGMLGVWPLWQRLRYRYDVVVLIARALVDTLQPDTPETTRLLSKFILCTRYQGASRTLARWDLVEYAIGAAEYDGAELFWALTALYSLDPSNPCWKRIAQGVHLYTPAYYAMWDRNRFWPLNPKEMSEVEEGRAQLWSAVEAYCSAIGYVHWEDNEGAVVAG